MSKQDIATVALYFALTVFFLVQSVNYLHNENYVFAMVSGALGVAYVFVTFHKYNKFRARSSS